MFIEPILYFVVPKFVCTLGATTNIYGLKWRIQGQFSKSQGESSNHFALHILGLSVEAIFISEGWKGFTQLFTEPSKSSLEHRWSDIR